MRAKYYLKLFGQMRLKKSFVLAFVILGIAIFLIDFAIKKITPTIDMVCKSKAKAIAVKITEETVKEYLESVKYDTLMNTTYNNEGKIIALKANIIEMNKLSSNISYIVQEKLMNIEPVPASIPLGKILGWSIFSGYGPNIKIKLVPIGNIHSEFETKFLSEGINQTRHTIYIVITCNMSTIAPFVTDSVTCTSTITVAETVIVGDIPDNYYNIDNLSEANKDGFIEIIP